MSMDWQSLTEKLRKMGVQVGLEKPMPEPTVKRKPIEDLVSGRDISTVFGPVFSVIHTYAQDHIHGKQILKPSGTWRKISEWAKSSELGNAPLESFIFLDTETTGLSGGTGTMAFMVGVGKFGVNGFQLEQFFLRNPLEERAQLAALVAFCENMQAVVTYNGKSFDIPILNSRFILQGMDTPFEDLPHFDLLHLTRRVWRARLEHCNLGIIEKAILEMERSEVDIPGYLVPEYYLEYLRTGDSAPIKSIFYHNEQDVVSLAALFSKLADILENPLAWESNSSKDLAALALVVEGMGQSELALQIYDRSMNQEQNMEALLRSANISKKRGEWEQAVRYWEMAADESAFANLELAKYYEHQLRDYALAEKYALNSLSLIELKNDTYAGRNELKALKHRLSRLKKKKEVCKPN